MPMPPKVTHSRFPLMQVTRRMIRIFGLSVRHVTILSNIMTKKEELIYTNWKSKDVDDMLMTCIMFYMRGVEAGENKITIGDVE